MQIVLPDNHPSLIHSYEVDQALKSFFRHSPLSYFQFTKIYKDGSSFAVTNKAALRKAFFSMNIRKAYSYVKPEFIDKHNYWFLWDHHLQDAPLELARQFDVSNGLGFMERKSDCYYMISFGTHNGFEGAVDYYLNNFDAIRNFIRYFRDTRRELTGIVEQNKILLPKSAQDPNKDVLLLSSQKRRRIPIVFDNRKSYITHKELDCIKRLPLGKTAKDISRDLKISHRTVEGYFSRVMMRVGCKNKQDLIAVLNSLG